MCMCVYVDFPFYTNIHLQIVFYHAQVILDVFVYVNVLCGCPSSCFCFLKFMCMHIWFRECVVDAFL